MKLFLFLKRVFKFGWLNFTRNWLVSGATIGVSTLMLSVILGLLFLNHTITQTLSFLQSRVDFSIYLKDDIEPTALQELQQVLTNFPEVKEVQVVSKEEAERIFKERNRFNEPIIKALQELGENPLVASVVVQVKNPSGYEKLTEYLDRSKFRASIEHITYQENRDAIQKIIFFSNNVKLAALVLSGFLVALTILVSLNTLRLVIYSQRDEISIMKLVGASNAFIQLPFLVTATIYGVAAFFITMILAAPLTYWITPFFAKVIPSLNLWGYFQNNLLYIAGIQLVFSLGVNMTSTFMAMRKHLKV